MSSPSAEKRRQYYAKKKGPAYSPRRDGLNPMLGAFESNGMHPITGRFYPVRHYTQAAADARAQDMRRNGWDRVTVVDTKKPVEVKLGGNSAPAPDSKVLPDYDDTTMGLDMRDVMEETRLERAQAEAAFPSLTGGEQPSVEDRLSGPDDKA